MSPRLLIALLGAAALVLGVPATATPATSTTTTTTSAASPAAVSRAASTVRLDGVTVRLRAGTRQVVTVNRTRSYRARVTFWVLRDGRWIVKRRTTDGAT